MPTFSIKESLRFGWQTFKSRPWIFVGAALIVFAINVLFSIPDNELSENFLYGIVSMIVSIFIQMGLIHFTLKAHDDVKGVKLMDLWYPTRFLPYLGAAILVFLAVVAGLILLIIPGIIVALALSLTNYLVIDRDMKPVEALKTSWHLTKGRRWKLFLFVLATAGINILGFVAFFVGALVTIPVTMLAMAHVYRLLTKEEEEETVVVAEAPAPAVPSEPVAA